jgi:hypothetical protein
MSALAPNSKTTKEMEPVLVGYLQAWTESELGRARRPAGYSLYLSLEAHAKHLETYKEQLVGQHGITAPNEFTFADGKPMPVAITPEAANRVAGDERGYIWLRDASAMARALRR